MFNACVVIMILIKNIIVRFMNSAQVVDSILSARYLREGEKTFQDIFHRVAYAIADNNTEATKFYDIMSHPAFSPEFPDTHECRNRYWSAICMFRFCQSLILINGIFDAMKNGAIIHKTGGGTGYNFSHDQSRKDPPCNPYRRRCFGSRILHGNF